MLDIKTFLSLVTVNKSKGLIVERRKLGDKPLSKPTRLNEQGKAFVPAATVIKAIIICFVVFFFC